MLCAVIWLKRSSNLYEKTGLACEKLGSIGKMVWKGEEQGKRQKLKKENMKKRG